MTAARFTRTCAGLACTTAMLIGTLVPAASAGEETPTKTRRNTLTAMHGEAMAHASYHFYAQQAGREGLGKVRVLFAKTAHTELHDHFTGEAGLIHFVRGDAANLRESIRGEREEATYMYPRFAREAWQDKDYNAARLFMEIARDEKRHARQFEKALYAITYHRGRIPEGFAPEPVEVPAGKPKVRSARTLRNLETAMRGEAFANAKYTLYAEHAEARSPELARLFQRAAAVELTEHFAGEAVLAGLVHRTADNLRRSIAGETYEATTMYPEFARVARAEGDCKAAELFTEIAGDEAAHARAFLRALRHLHHYHHMARTDS
ncbi:ferritin family protein [Actinomadura formosensis]|uniref:ferritin family protein n=1 Tax=Actinomadura formosensis TaxID=60706 RepID=UPI000A7EBDDF|nr:ferritin family protein [Actinomadura formosensis]